MLASHADGLTRQGIALWVMCGLAASAWAADTHPSLAANRTEPAAAADTASTDTAGPSFDFNIPAQPLTAALNQYGAVSDQPAVFVSEMAIGRTSSAVQGTYSAEAGLRLLLQGTGLSFEKISSDLGTTFLLKEAGKPATRATLAAFYSLAGYPGLIQARIQEVLCADPLIKPGQYNALFRFQLDGSGHVHHVVLLDSTGNARRDNTLLAALQHVNVDPPPPPTVAEQSLTMRLRLRDSNAGSPCEPRQESRQ